MDAPFRATYQTKRMLYEMMLCAEHRGAYVGYVRGEFSRTLTGFFQEVSSAFRFPYTFSWSWESMAVLFAAAVGHKPAGKAVHAGGGPHGPCECTAALYRGRRVLLVGKAGPV